MTIIHALSTPLLRIQLNQRINPHNSHTSLHSTLQLLNLTHTGLEHTSLQTVVHSALDEIEAVVPVALGFGHLFRVGVRGGRLRSVASAGCGRVGGRSRSCVWWVRRWV